MSAAQQDEDAGGSGGAAGDVEVRQPPSCKRHTDVHLTTPHGSSEPCHLVTVRPVARHALGDARLAETAMKQRETLSSPLSAMQRRLALTRLRSSHDSGCTKVECLSWRCLHMISQFRMFSSPHHMCKHCASSRQAHNLPTGSSPVLAVISAHDVSFGIIAAEPPEDI